MRLQYKLLNKMNLFILILFTIISVSNSIYSQNSDAYQIQATLNSGLPANSGDNFGVSVAIDGDTAIVGTQNQDIGANAVQGAAYVYIRNGSTWSLQQMLTSSDGRQFDKFGAEVALEGDTAFVARYNPNTIGFGDGKIYVFKRTGTTWTETQTIVSNDIAAGDAFGSAMAVDNGTLVAGAPGKGFLGAVYIFASGGNGTWTQQTKLTQKNPVIFDNFGWSVDISGNSLIIGNPGAAGSGAEQGRGFAYIFTGSGTSWMQQQKIQASDRAAGDQFGFDVAISGDTAAISAINDDDFRGGVYVFTRNGGTWTEQTKIVHPLTSGTNRFGLAVDLEGQTLAVTVPRLETQPDPTRGVVVYMGSGATWNQIDFLETSGASCVDIDNNTIISGQATSGNSTNGEVFIHATSSAPTAAKLVGNNLTVASNFGKRVSISNNFALTGGLSSVNLFTRNDESWSFTREINSSSLEETASPFNGGIGISDSFMAIGSVFATVNGVSDLGAVYTFNLVNGVFVDQQRLVAPDGVAGDRFGEILAFTENTIVIGSPDRNSSRGAIYVFVKNGNAWEFQQKLTASDGVNGESFGKSLAISGDTIVVGTGTINFEGKAYIFTRLNGVWTEQQKLTASDGRAANLFGGSVDIQDNTIVVGSENAINNSVRNGATYIFTRNGNTFMEQQKIFVARNAIIGFGRSVSISNDKIAVGAVFEENSKGAAYIFQKAGNTWNKIRDLSASDGEDFDFFGESIDISGNRVVVGSPNADVNSVLNVGAGYVFKLENNSAPKISANFNFDFDGDGKADLSVFRPSEGNWYLNQSTAGFGVVNFGISTDQLTPADFDGDGKTDIAVWREDTQSIFYILQSSDFTIRQDTFGITGDNPKVTGDWDGDGKADVAVYREGTQSTFYYRGSNDNPNGNTTFLNWGQTDDKPMRGDFDGDGKLDLAIHRPANGVWYILQSSDGAVRYVSWGLGTDKFATADYDGDSKTDLAVYRDGIWYILQSSDGQPRYVSFGIASDQLVPADYDGDGKADVAVYRDGIWYVLESTSGNASVSSFGLAGDKPIASSFVQ